MKLGLIGLGRMGMGIAERLRRGGHEVTGFDEVISNRDPDFAQSGLKAASLIRLGFLAALPVGSFLGSIGAIDPTRHRRLLKRLADHLLAEAASSKSPC